MDDGETERCSMLLLPRKSAKLQSQLRHFMPDGGRVPHCKKNQYIFYKLQRGKPLPGNIQMVLSSDIVRFTKDFKL